MNRMFRSLFAGPPARVSPVSTEGPKPARLMPLPGDTNPILAWLDTADLPWREHRAAVEARNGISRDPAYDRDVIQFETEPSVLPGLIHPLTAHVDARFAPDLPIIGFHGVSWFSNDADQNVRRMAAAIAEHLGPAPIGKAYNTFGCRWTAGAAFIQLTAWPPAWQSPKLVNPAWEREPRLATACHIGIGTGYRRPLDALETRWLDTFEPLIVLDHNALMTPARLRETAASETMLEFVREPTTSIDHLFGRIGRSGDGAALIFCLEQLYLVQTEQIERFEVDRLLPAKGGGGSYLDVRCLPSAGMPAKTLHIGSASKPDGLTAAGERLGRVFDKPCTIGAYVPDA